MPTCIVITPPQTVAHEIATIHALFENGLPLLHIRKPDFSFDEMGVYLRQISSQWHGQIVLHQHFEWAKYLHLRGIHLNEKIRRDEKENLLKQYPFFEQSTSVHQLEDLIAEAADFDRIFISKLFDSISKKEAASIDLNALKATIQENDLQNVIGLGGICDQHITSLTQLGLEGIALLGAIWESQEPVAVLRNFLPYFGDK